MDTERAVNDVDNRRDFASIFSDKAVIVADITQTSPTLRQPHMHLLFEVHMMERVLSFGVLQRTERVP